MKGSVVDNMIKKYSVEEQFFHKMIMSTFRGVIHRPPLGEFRPSYYMPSIRTLVFYDDGFYSRGDILKMKYEIFNKSIDPIIDVHIYELYKPSTYIKHIRIRKGLEPYAISNIMLNAQEDTDSYEDVLRVTTSNVLDEYEEKQKYQLKY